MDDSFPKTTTVLAIDLPGDLGDRLRRALRGRPGMTMRDLALEALDDWLDRHSSEDGARAIKPSSSGLEPGSSPGAALAFSVPRRS